MRTQVRHRAESEKRIRHKRVAPRVPTPPDRAASLSVKGNGVASLMYSNVTENEVGHGHSFNISCMAVIYVPTGVVVMALRKASGEAMVEMVCVPSPTP